MMSKANAAAQTAVIHQDDPRMKKSSSSPKSHDKSQLRLETLADT
jgi:hypothetical protein